MPVAKARARVVNGHSFTPKKTASAEKLVKDEWVACGRPRLADGPLGLEVTFYFPRPKGHFNTKGLLNAEGLRHPAPTGRPDADNLLKLIWDALNGLAWRDDSQFCDVHVRKAYCSDGCVPGVSLSAWSIGTLPPDVEPGS